MSLNVQQPLMFLLYMSIFAVLIITFFLVKLLMDLLSLVKSMQSLSGIVKHELKPTIREFKRALININSITNNADLQVNNINKTLSSGLGILSGSTSGIISKAKIITSSLKQGILTGLQVFIESRKN